MREQLNTDPMDIARRLAEMPITAEVAPGVTPGAMPFKQKLHDRQREGFVEYRSSTLLESSDPATEVLNFDREFSLYFEAMSQEDKEAAAHLADQRPEGERMPRVSVCLPVATHEEGRNLYKTLERYTHQTASKDDFEIYLFLNRPAVDKDGQPTDDSETLQALADFKRDYPDSLLIREVSTIFPEPKNLGEIKKILFDSCMLRAARAGVTDPIIIMNDADMVVTPDEYITQYIDYFTTPTIDAVIGEFDLDHGAYVTHPFVHVANRVHTLVGAIKGNNVKRILSANNSAIRGSAYCAIGGNTKMRRSSDAYLGIVLSELRGTDATVLRPEDTRINIQTSARRVVAAWHKGLAPNEKWRLNLGAHNPEVRSLPQGVVNPNQLFDLTNVSEFDLTLSYVLNRLIANYESPDDDPRGWDSPIYPRALGMLGLTCVIEQNENHPVLQLGDTSHLRSALGIFRNKHLETS